MNNIFKYIFENKIISKIKIGNPEQEMMVIFSNEEKYFYLSKNQDIITDKFLYQFLYQGKFSKDLSTSFILINKIDYITKRYNIIHMGEDDIIFDDNTKIKFQFFIESDNKNEQIYFGIIGIGLDKNKDLLNYPKFINQLKDCGLINNYYWYINYEKNSLIIGEELGDENNYNYQYQEISTKPYYDINDENLLIIDWNILFDEIYMEEQCNKNKFILHDDSGKAHGILDIDFGFIVGSPVYRIFLNEIFFDDLIKNKKCINRVYISENKYKSNYYFYYCIKIFEKEIKENFQTLKFESK